MLPGNEAERCPCIGDQDFAAALEGGFSRHIVVDATVAQFHATAQVLAVKTTMLAADKVLRVRRKANRPEQGRETGGRRDRPGKADFPVPAQIAGLEIAGPAS